MNTQSIPGRFSPLMLPYIMQIRVKILLIVSIQCANSTALNLKCSYIYCGRLTARQMTDLH